MVRFSVMHYSPCTSKQASRAEMQKYPEKQHVLSLGRRARTAIHSHGAPEHFSLVVRRDPNRNFRGRWTGRGGATAWPPRSP
jgi:hypothetical protein